MRPRVRHPPMYNRVLRNPIHPVIRRVQSVAAAALDGVGAALHQNHCRNRSLSKDWAFCRSWCAPSSTRRCGPSESSTWGMSTVTGPTRARTVNGLERLNREIRRRTRVAVLYPQRGFPPGPGNGDCQGGQRGVADRPTLSPSAPTPPISLQPRRFQFALTAARQLAFGLPNSRALPEARRTLPAQPVQLPGDLALLATALHQPLARLDPRLSRLCPGPNDRPQRPP